MKIRGNVVSWLTSLLLVSSALAAPDPTAPPAILDEPSQRQIQRLEYVKHIVKDAYEANAPKNPLWDKSASLAIDYFTRDLSSNPLNDGDEARPMYFKAGEAITAGCDDPLIHFCRAKLLTRGQEKIEEVCAAADKLRENSKYGPYIRAYILTLAAWWAQTDPKGVADAKIQPHIRENVDAFMALLPEIFNDKDLPAELLIDLMRNVGYVSMYVEGDRMKLLDKANPILEKSVQPKSLVLAVRGREMISYAWDGIGRGLPAAPPNGAQLFSDRIQKARELLEESWKLWPNCEAATEIILALKLQSVAAKVDIGNGSMVCARDGHRFLQSHGLHKQDAISNVTVEWELSRDRGIRARDVRQGQLGRCGADAPASGPLDGGLPEPQGAGHGPGPRLLQAAAGVEGPSTALRAATEAHAPIKSHTHLLHAGRRMERALGRGQRSIEADELLPPHESDSRRHGRHGQGNRSARRRQAQVIS